MPIFKIQALPQNKDINITNVISKLCTGVAEATKIDSKRIWATWQTLDPEHYVEADIPALEQPRTSHAPLVHVYSFSGKSPETVETILETSANILCKELNLKDGNIFIVYDELPSGRAYSGGQIIKK